MSNWKKNLLILGLLTGAVAAPLALRDTGADGADQADLRLDVITVSYTHLRAHET